MISTSKNDLSLNNLKILRPKVTKNLNKFCESPPCALIEQVWILSTFNAAFLVGKSFFLIQNL